MERKKIWWIVGLLTLMWASVAGQYMEYIDTLGYDKCCLAGLIDVTIITVVMMIIPFIFRLVNKERLDFINGKKICKWNSIGMFILSVIMTVALDGNGFVGIGGVGALIFYYINKWLFVSGENSLWCETQLDLITGNHTTFYVQEKQGFFDDNIVFVQEGYGDYYYTYDCVEKITDGEEYSYWAYNNEAAISKGYRKGNCY